MFKRIFIIAFLLSAMVSTITAKPVFLVYCGITMAQPIEAIAKKIESEFDVNIHVVKGGSGKLYQTLTKSFHGDLFLPGSDSYIKKLKKEHQGMVVDEVSVGKNQLAVFVKKGNPKQIPLNLDSLYDHNYRVFIGSAKMGSVGKVTKAILEKKGIYEQVKKNARMTSHSKGLLNAIKNNKSDITLNWHAVSTWPGNNEFVEAMSVPASIATPKKLVLAQLNSSKNPVIAKAFCHPTRFLILPIYS